MKNLCFWLLLCSISLQNVVSLKCYTSNLIEALHGQSKYDLKECNIGKQTLFVCYKVVVNSEHGHGIKGCVIPGGCAAIEARVKLEHVGATVSCLECDTDDCNSATKVTMFSLLGFVLAMLTLML